MSNLSQPGYLHVPSQIMLRIGNALVWVDYPSSVSRAEILAFLETYYFDHPAKFKPWNTIEFTLSELRVMRYESIRQRKPKTAPADITTEPVVAYRENSGRYYKSEGVKVNDPDLKHGTHFAYNFARCRCQECREFRYEYHKRNYQAKKQAV